MNLWIDEPGGVCQEVSQSIDQGQQQDPIQQSWCTTHYFPNSEGKIILQVPNRNSQLAMWVVLLVWCGGLKCDVECRVVSCSDYSLVLRLWWCVVVVCFDSVLWWCILIVCCGGVVWWCGVMVWCVVMVCFDGVWWCVLMVCCGGCSTSFLKWPFPSSYFWFCFMFSFSVFCFCIIFVFNFIWKNKFLLFGTVQPHIADWIALAAVA